MDLSWNSATPTGLAIVEICLALVCAALPIFWPVFENSWGKIFVTYEVEIKRESGVFVPRKLRKQRQQRQQQRKISSPDFELDICAQQWQPLPGDAADGDPPGWDPYVGDATTGLGESDAVVVSPAGAGRPESAGFRI